MKKFALLFFSSICIISASFAQSITPEIIADLSNVSEVAISPNGTQIAYTVRVPGGDASGHQKSILKVIPKAGGVAKDILGKEFNARSIAWSNDGKSIYCLLKDTVKKSVQVNNVQIQNSEVKAITSGARSVKHFAFSPDEKKLGIIYGDEKNATQLADEKLKKDWDVVGEKQMYDRIYVTDATMSYPPKDVSTKVLHVTDFIWSPDGKNIFFKGSDKTSVDYTMMYQSIYRISADGGSPEVVCKTEGKLGSMDVSPDGKNLAYCGAVDISDPLAQSVFIVPAAGGDDKNFTPDYKGSAVDLKWTNSATVLVLTAEGCYSALKKIDIKTGKMSDVYNKGAIIRGMSLDLKTGAMAFSACTPQHPYEVFTGTVAGGLKKITDHNPVLKTIKLTKQEVISWSGAEEWQIEGVLTYPKDYKAGAKYPLLLQLHGGPEGVSANGFNTRAIYPAQLYAANGFFVLEPNYRGSQGRGVAFAKGDHNDLGGAEYDDVLAGIDHLVAKGMVDNNKVGTGGFSYGGYFSAWGGTKHSKRFKAAVMGAGISNWISFSGTTEIIHENSLVHWNLWWYDDMTLVWDRSPLAHINEAQTPMLIVHGGADTRVPLTQSEEMYNALKLKKVPTELVIYQRQPHGILEREAQLDFMNRTLNWFKEYVK